MLKQNDTKRNNINHDLPIFFHGFSWPLWPYSAKVSTIEHIFKSPPRELFIAAPDRPNDATGAYIVPSPHCFTPSGAHQPGSTCEHLSPQGEMWGHTHTHTHSSPPTQAIHGPFQAPNQHASPFAALSPAREFPTNHRLAYSHQSQIRLF